MLARPGPKEEMARAESVRLNLLRLQQGGRGRGRAFTVRQVADVCEPRPRLR